MNQKTQTTQTTHTIHTIALTFILIAATLLPATAQMIRRVTPMGTGDGSSWATAMNLQTALGASSANDQVWIAAGTYKPHADDRAATFSISAGVLVYGGFAGNEAALADRAGTATILSGDLASDDIDRPADGDMTDYNNSRDDNSNTVVTVTGSNVTLDGLTITAGEGNIGAGLRVNFSDISVTDCTFTKNSASTRGGGASFTGFGGTATLTDCTFTNNSASTRGGGAYFTEILGSGGTATLTGCTFTKNRAYNGNGGGTHFEMPTTLTACTFTGNMATFNGGGTYSTRDATLTNSVFASNTATNRGGGAWLRVGGTVINSTFYANTTTIQGGGLYVTFEDTNTHTVGLQTNPFTLQNSILVGNTVASTTSGNQTYVNNTNAANIVTLQNNLISGGTDPRGTDQGIEYATPGSGNITEAGTVDESDASVVFESTATDNANYLRLKAGSPAVNAGNNAYIPSGIITDAVGAARIQDGTVDLGAYEGAVAPEPQTITFTSPDTGVAGGTITLAATATSTLSVTFAIESQTLTSGTGNVVTLAAGVLTLENPGTVVITATQAGDVSGGITYAPATQTQTITVRDPTIPAIFRVKPTATGTMNGSSWANAMTLQAALAAAIVAGDQIWIAQGTYKPHADDRDATFSISASVLVYGGFDPVADAADTDASSRSGAATILSGDLEGDDGTRPPPPADAANPTPEETAAIAAYDDTRDDNSYTVVTLVAEDVSLDGLTITAGTLGGDGGGGAGLYTEFFAVGTMLRDCLFTDNEAFVEGGGAYLREGATLTNCTFTGNEATRGGGVHLDGNGTLTDCTFTDNEAKSGGGIYFDSQGTLINCVLAGNTATSNGGGVYFRGTSTTINTTFYNNTATDQGGGLFTELNDQQLNLQNSILIGNTARNAASGHQAYVINSDAVNVVNLQHNLLAGGATGGGAGIRMVNLNGGSANVTEAGTVDESDASVVFASTTAGEANYLHLKEFSPAVGAGNNDYVRNATPPITTDAADVARIQEVTVDLGAYESTFATPTPQTLTFTSAATRVAGRMITLAVTASSGLTPVTFAITRQAPTSGTGNVATLAAGVLTLENPGTVVITATQAGGNSGGTTYAAVTQTQTITVRDPAIPTIFRATEGGASRGTDGSNWTDQAMTLEAALAAAIVAGDQIWIAQGTYKPHANDRRATFSISAGVLVYGGFDGTEAALADRAGAATILSGNVGNTGNSNDNSYTVVTVTGADVTLDGLTITAGDGLSTREGENRGGGLYAESGATGTVLRNCLFTNNYALFEGGAAYLRAGAKLTNCTFTDNEARFGGGVDFSGDATLTGCTFTDNVAEYGGGIYFDSQGTLINCVFAGNTATINGGGVYFRGTSTTINTTFYNNTATEQGGGLFTELNDQQLNLQNSLLIGNTARNAASGHQIYVLNRNTVNVVNLQHNLLAGGATGGGAGIRMESTDGGSANVTEAGTVAESDASVVFASTTASEANYLHLKDGSPAVGAGNNDYVNNATPRITTDAAGAMRIQGGTVDLGAYESASAPTAPTIALSGTGITGDATPGYTVSVAADVGTLDVMVDIGGSATQWTVTTDDAAITTSLNNPITMTGDGTAVITISDNPSTTDTRTATLTFTSDGTPAATATVAITQLAAIPVPPPSITLSSPTATAVAGGETVDVTVTFANADSWTAVPAPGNPAGMVSGISPTTGTANGTVQITIAANTGAERMATITFNTVGGTGTAATATLTITQDAAPPTITLGNTAITAIAAGEMVDVTVDIGGSATQWTVATDDAMITPLLNPATMTGDGSTTITIAPNPGAERMVTITFTTDGTPAATATLTITQDAVIPPSISLNKTDETVAATAGTLEVIVTLGGTSVTGWTVTSVDNNGIIPNLPDPAAGNTVIITIAENMGAERMATLTFTTTNGTTGTTATATLTITQAAAPPTITLSNTAITVGPDAGTRGINVNIGGGATQWTVTTSDGFITLTNSAMVMGDGIAQIGIAENMGAERMATLTFTTDGTPAATATLTITQQVAGATPVPFISLSSITENVAATGGTVTVNVTFGDATSWEVTSTMDDDDIITFPGITTGTVNGSLMITIAANTTTSTRTATLTFTTVGGTGPAATATLTITQAAIIPPTIALSGMGITGSTSTGYTASVGGAENMLDVMVDIENATEWTVTNTDGFITLPDPPTVMDDGTAQITIGDNPSTTDTRTATLTFTTTNGTTGTTAMTTLVITQAAATPAPVIALSGTAIMGDADAGYTVEAGTAESMLTVDVMPTDATGWAVTTTTDTDGIITLAPLMGAADVDAVITIAANTTTATRTATLTFTTTGGTGTAATATLVITQQAAAATPDPPAIALSGTGITGDASADYTVEAEAAESMLTVDVMPTDATGWEVTTTTDTDGIITLAPLMGAADVDAVITIAANTTTSTRTATLTFTTTGGTGTAATATLTITQQAATATPDPPSIALSGTGIMGDASAGYTVEAEAAESMLTIDVMPTDATGWVVTTTTDTDGIITLAPLMGAADIDAVITIAANTTTATRTATLTFTTTGGTGTAATAMLTITQALVLGFEEDGSEFTLYPNPTSGKLHFSEQVAEFRLYSVEGRLLETQENVRSVDLMVRPSGMYFAEVIRDGRSVRWRVVRE